MSRCHRPLWVVDAQKGAASLPRAGGARERRGEDSIIFSSVDFYIMGPLLGEVSLHILKSIWNKIPLSNQNKREMIFMQSS